MIWHDATGAVTAGVVIVAAITDLRRGAIYNWLTYPAIVVGLALGAAEGAAAGSAVDGLADHVLGFGVAFGILLAAYLLGGMGGGDVKLMGAVGVLLGWPGAIHAVVYSLLVGATLGLILMVWRGQTPTVLRRLWMAARILPLPTARMDDAVPISSFRVPFGFAVCIGTLWYMTEEATGGSLLDVVGRLL